MTDTVASLGTIVGVWAHPDDEAYLSGALMAAAIANGQRVVCITATRGEAADPDNVPPAEMAAIRERELAACLEALGDGRIEHRWLPYADGACDAVDEAEAIEAVRAVLVEVGADTVLTFGPEGMTGHRDHIAVSRWATAAAAATGIRALWASHTHQWAEQWNEVGDQLDVMMDDIELPVTADRDLVYCVPATGEWLDRKERAMLAQASQVDVLRDAVGAERFRMLLVEEAFRAAD